jgi:hypothetical protein
MDKCPVLKLDISRVWRFNNLTFNRWSLVGSKEGSDSFVNLDLKLGSHKTQRQSRCESRYSFHDELI